MDNLNTLGLFSIAADYIPDHFYLWLLCDIVRICVQQRLWQTAQILIL
jgi:hypothetical protein